MKTAAIILLFAAVTSAVPKYRSFENIDVTKYKRDKNHLTQLYNCIRGAGACSELEANFKARGEQIVATQCEDCRDKEIPIVHDLITLIGNDDPYKLHIVLEVFDPKSRNSRSFLDWLIRIDSTTNIPDIPYDVVEEFYDLDDDARGKGGKKKPKKGKFIDNGGLLGAVGKLLRGLLGVVGV